MKHYEATTTIRATPEKVWEILTDGPGWERWNSGAKLDGEIAPGNKVKLTSEASGDRVFVLRVTKFNPPQGMTFSGGMPLWLFRGVRTFRLDPEADGATRFSMREEYSGPLLPLIWRSMPDLQPSFDRFVAGLKGAAEG
jgi:uncharacterized protein YndB with AHSA1/START domain